VGSLHSKSAAGDFQGCHRDVWFNARGYDERMTGWGGMDLDLIGRFESLGIIQKWLNPEPFRIYHQYHDTGKVSLNDINMRLSFISKGSVVNSGYWGEIPRKVKIGITCAGLCDIKEIYESLDAKERNDFMFFVRPGYVENINDEDNVVVINGKGGAFFIEARKKALAHYCDYYFEFDCDSFRFKTVYDLFCSRDKHKDIVFGGEYIIKNRILAILFKKAFKTASYFSVRAMNARALAIVSKYVNRRTSIIASFELYRQTAYQNGFEKIIVPDCSSISVSTWGLCLELIGWMFRRLMVKSHRMKRKLERFWE